jgi:hypothetical protein
MLSYQRLLGQALTALGIFLLLMSVALAPNRLSASDPDGGDGLLANCTPANCDTGNPPTAANCVYSMGLCSNSSTCKKTLPLCTNCNCLRIGTTNFCECQGL